MAVCVECGKKGLLLRVNSDGRCKKCEEKYQSQQRERKRIEEEKRIALEKEKAEKENVEIACAKEELYKILDRILLLDQELYPVITEKCEKFIPIIDKRIEQSHELRWDLIWNAQKNPYFLKAVKEYAYSENEPKKYQLTGIQEGIKNRIKGRYADPDFMIIQYLNHFSEEFEKAWKKEKKEIERYLNSSRKTCDDSIKVEKNLNSQTKIDKRKFDTMPDCVITDIETTGLIYNRNSIIEIAAIKIVDGKVSGTYSSLIHRDKPLSSKITELTGITTKMLRECNKSLDIVMAGYRDFVGSLPLVGHNIKSFDIRFINEAYMKVFNEPISNECMDTLQLSYQYICDAESHKLGELADFVGIPTGTAHRALGDCETTLYLYEYMMNIVTATFLKWSKKGKKFEGTDEKYPKYLTANYLQGKCHELHKRLIETGYLVEADAKSILSGLKVEELKSILSKNGIATNGKKAELIARLIENIDIKELDIQKTYLTSDKGIELMNRYGDL